MPEKPSLPPDPRVHLRRARMWGIVALAGWAIIGAVLAFFRDPATRPTMPLSIAAGLIISCGFLAFAEGRRSRCTEGFVWMALGLAAALGFLWLLKSGLVGVAG